MARDFGRNIPRTTQPAPAVARVDGQSVHIHGDAIQSWETLAAEPSSGIADLSTFATVSVKEIRDSIGVEGIRKAAADAGRRAPSDRTIRRWVAANRIPHSNVEMRAQRRSFVERQGGTKVVADKVGLSPSAISRWQQGQTERFRQQRHRMTAEEIETADMLARAGLSDSRGNLIKNPIITVKAHFEYRNNGSTSSDYRDTREIIVVLPKDSVDAKDFAIAVVRENHAAAIAVIERHLTLDYAQTFFDYDDDTGFHIEWISSFTVRWE